MPYSFGQLVETHATYCTLRCSGEGVVVMSIILELKVRREIYLPVKCVSIAPLQRLTEQGTFTECVSRQAPQCAGARLYIT